MKIINVVYPIEPGFIWLLWQNGLWGGWREGALTINGGRLIPIISFRSGCEEHRVFFYPINHRMNGERWKPAFEDNPGVEHFDFWGLPSDQLHSFEKEHLKRIIDMGLVKLNEPLTVEV